MDFSTADRALASLSRRLSPLSAEVLELSKRLSCLLRPSSAGGGGSPGMNNDAEYARGMLRLIELASGGDDGAARWEPLAVGMRLAVDYLNKRTGDLFADHVCDAGGIEDEDEGTGLGTGGGGVYAEGPRVPKVADGNAMTPMERLDKKKSCSHPYANSPVFELMSVLPSFIKTHVEHDEPRVRSLVAQAVGAHALFATSFLGCMGSEVNGASDAMEQAVQNAQEGRRNVHRAILHSLKSHLEMKEPSRVNNPSTASDGALDDTTGWRALETNLHALASYVDGCVGRAGADGYRGGSYIAEEIRLFGSSNEDAWFLSGLKHCCVAHVNRHVRAASAAVLGVLVKACVRSHVPSHHGLLIDDDSPFRSILKESLRFTLADNWSQVRMAGSVLCRRFVRALLRIDAYSTCNREDDKDEEELTVFESAAGDLVPMLLPRMCLNRFYIAQGVKLYSQETWKFVFGAHSHSPDELYSSSEARGGGGIGAVARIAAPLCRYYSKMCDADNHAVREAACQGVAELVQKVGKHPLYSQCLSPYVTMLLQALLMCFHDESWPVRDEACLACGTFCLAYADECVLELPILFERWTEHLTDQIWSVREDAAVALGDAITAYGPDMLQRVLAVVRKNLPAVREQPTMTREEYKKLQNDVSAHTGNQLYSCGSLAPKLRKGGAGRIGCSSCAIVRPKAPWEATDGCIYLLRELCVRFANSDYREREDVVMCDNILLPLMTELADVCRLSHYPQSDDLRTTLWRQLFPIAKALGKRRFKGLYLDLFIELLSKNFDDHNTIGASQLSIHAAGQCAEDVANLIGIGILRGRMTTIGREEAFDRIMEERRREQRMAMATGRFGKEVFHSPLGPPMAGPIA